MSEITMSDNGDGAPRQSPPPPLDEQISALEQHITNVSSVQGSSEQTLRAAVMRLDATIADHVTRTLPALSELVAVSRFFWAGMLDDDLSDEGGDGFDEEDVERSLRSLESLLVSFNSGALASFGSVGDSLRQAVEVAELEAQTSHKVAGDLWLEVDQERLPEARSLLRLNMEGIASCEKALAQEGRLAEEALEAQHLAVKSHETDNGGLQLNYTPLETPAISKFQEGRVRCDAVTEGRKQLMQAFNEHQRQAHEVTRLVCQGTTLKVLRDDLRVRTLVLKSITRRQDMIEEAAVKARDAAELLLDSVKDILNKLEWTDIKEEGSFPVEDLLKLSAQLLSHIVAYCNESNREEVINILKLLEAGNGTPLPPSVTRILKQFQPREIPDQRNKPYQATVDDLEASEANLPAARDRETLPIPIRTAPPPAYQSEAPTASGPIPSLQGVQRQATLNPLDPMPFEEDLPPPQPPQLQILGASWGGKDVTSKLQTRIKDNQLAINTNSLNAIFGDPMPYKYKLLTALYRYGDSGTPRLFIINEEQPLFSNPVYVIKPDPVGGPPPHPTNRLSIPVGEGWRSADGSFEILAVTYGPRNVRNEAVLMSLCDYFSGTIPSLRPGNGFFRGDPWPNNVKTWTVFVRLAREGGAVRCLTGLEDRGMDRQWRF